MLLPHHWLCFILFAALIFPACAAPTLQWSQYTVTVVHKDGKEVEWVLPTVSAHIISLINAMGPELDHSHLRNVQLSNVRGGAGKHIEMPGMAYFKLQGGKFCPKTRDCWGYIATIDSVHDTIWVGAVVIHYSDSDSYIVIDFIPPNHVDEDVENHRKKYLEFLGTFTPVEKWAKAMLPVEGPAAGTFMVNQSKLREIRSLLSQGLLQRFAKDVVPPPPHAANRFVYMVGPGQHTRDPIFKTRT
ncbi:hypothetical protein BDP27DRAFT_1417301 [Rhodocollybia butyracea]|uniref:Uncharacterized protein n=1 Tax=Rhodocollybia butyracea TaxID=206335 RepID=A0A9P5Q1Q4_9AGAR|nr:hypothetical protein BDP27DRAFT_1417301 [Rhodocollybia butyracea]